MTTLEQIRAKRTEILAIAERNGVENLHRTIKGQILKEAQPL